MLYLKTHNPWNHVTSHHVKYTYFELFVCLNLTYCLIFVDLSELAPNEFLSPFLDVIRSEDTTGPITGLALTSINKFLSYGLIGKQF